MDDSETPEKRRKLEEVHDAPETKDGHTQGSQMTLGERKRKGPRVLVNKLNVNHDVIERLRRITKMCGKKMAAVNEQDHTANKVEVNGSNPTENKEEITNGFHNEKGEEKRLPQEDGSKESSDKDSEQTVKPIQNGVKLTENGHKKSEDDDKEMQLQAAADVDIFRQVLREVIEQRTKLVEEVVAANSIKLQNRIRELERENRELQWNARKVFGAFKQFIIEQGKKKRPKTSQSVQVNIEANIGSEVPASPVIPQLQTITVTKPSVQITTAGGMVSSNPTTSARPTSLKTNVQVVTSRSDPGLTHSLQKSTVEQSPVQVHTNATSHPQHKSTEPHPSTAVVYTVKPRPTQLTVQQDGNKEQNRVQVSRTNVIETSTSSTTMASTTSCLPARTGPSSEQPVSKTFQQPRPIEPRNSLSGSPPDTMSPSQTNSSLGMIRQNQITQLQQRELHQQPRVSHTPVSLAQQERPPESTASFLQQLQRQQQLQQQHHYAKVLQQQQQQQQESQVRHLLTTQTQSQQGQYHKQQSESSMSSISAPAQRQQDPSRQQKQQLLPNGISSGLLQEKQQSIRSPALSTPQQGHLALSHQGTSQRPMYSLVNRQSQPQPSNSSNLPPSSAPFNATLVNNVLRGDGRSLMTSAGKSHVSVVPSEQVPQSHSTSQNQSSLSNPRSNLENSNTLVRDHINKIANHLFMINGRTASPVQATAKESKEKSSTGGQQSANLQRRECTIQHSSSSKDVSTMQFRKSFSGETFHTRNELASNQRVHSRPPPESFQQQVQHPNTHIQRQERVDRQPQMASTHKHGTLETGLENISTGLQQPRDASSVLPTAVVPTLRKLEPKVPSMQQNILVSARKKHTDEELLPSGYRFSLPSPEYLLQRQRLQQVQTQPQHPQISQPSKSQFSQNMSLAERLTVSSGQAREQTRMVYTMQSPAEDMAAVHARSSFLQARNDTALNQKSGNEVLPSSGHRLSSEIRLPQQKQQEFQVQQPGQAHQIQSRSNQAQQHLQGKQQLNAPTVTNEGENRLINLQSLYRQPIQSPGISSSDPRCDKHPREAGPNAIVATTGNSTNDQRDAHKPLPKPSASIAVMDKGIVLSWNMEYDEASIHIDNYELFACQDITESKGQPIKWKKIGIVKALPLPMACTLTQFSSGSKYFFSVRAVDEHERAGPFSDPCTVSLTP